MKEKDVVRRANTHLRETRGWVIDTNTDAVICRKCGTKILPNRGHPDCTVARHYIEHKVLYWPERRSFSFSNIDEEQRKKLTEHAGISYLCLHIVERHYDVDDRYVAAYLVPWKEWLLIEKRMSRVADYLPYDVLAPRTIKALRDDKELGQYDILHWLARHKLDKDDKLYRFKYRGEFEVTVLAKSQDQALMKAEWGDVLSAEPIDHLHPGLLEAIDD